MLKEEDVAIGTILMLVLFIPGIIFPSEKGFNITDKEFIKGQETTIVKTDFEIKEDSLIKGFNKHLIRLKTDNHRINNDRIDLLYLSKNLNKDIGFDDAKDKNEEIYLEEGEEYTVYFYFPKISERVIEEYNFELNDSSFKTY